MITKFALSTITLSMVVLSSHYIMLSASKGDRKDADSMYITNNYYNLHNDNQDLKDELSKVKDSLKERDDLIAQLKKQIEEFSKTTVSTVKGRVLPPLDELRRAVDDYSAERGIPAEWLLAAMSFETAGTFSTSIKNGAGSGATGLIQFMPSTAVSLGTSVAELERMTAVEQFEYVKKYLDINLFGRLKGRKPTFEDVYMSILYPAAVGKGKDYKLFHTKKQYQQNHKLDINKDGKVTTSEAANKVKKHLAFVKRGNGVV